MARRPGPSSKQISSALVALGLTALEADAYTFLVREGPSTAYRIAQGLGKPAGALYKSLEAMESRGFVLSADEEGGRLYRATPVREVGSRVVREVERAAASAARELGRAESGEDAPDDRLYAIVDRGAALERARAMIDRACDFVLLAACPVFVAELGDALGAAAARHVAIGMKVFAPVEIAGAHVVVDARGDSAWREGPGQWLSMSVDGRSMLGVLLDRDGGALRTAHWSRNAMLNWEVYTGLSTNVLLAEAEGMLARGASGPEVMRALEGLHRLQPRVSGGKSELQRRYRASSAAGKHGVRGRDGGRRDA